MSAVKMLVGTQNNGGGESKVTPFRRILGVVLLASLLSGCLVTFTNPLPSSQPTGRDERLLGTWDGQDQEGNHVLVRFEGDSNRETKVTLTGGSGFRNVDFRMVTTKIEGCDYMVLTLAGRGNDKEHIIAKYVVKDDGLMICIFDVQKVRAAIAQNKVEGEVGRSMLSGATITASPKEVLSFLSSPASKDLFTCLEELKKLPAK
jgi:hypothetical protein